MVVKQSLWILLKYFPTERFGEIFDLVLCSKTDEFTAYLMLLFIDIHFTSLELIEEQKVCRATNKILEVLELSPQMTITGLNLLYKMNKRGVATKEVRVLQKIESLQSHPSETVYELSKRLIDEFYSESFE